MVQSKEKKFRKKKCLNVSIKRIQEKKGSMKPTIEPKKKKIFKKMKNETTFNVRQRTHKRGKN